MTFGGKQNARFAYVFDAVAIMHYLDENEHVEANDGYIGEAPKHVKTPNMFTQREN